MGTLRTSIPAATADKGEEEGEGGIVGGCIPVYSSTCLHVSAPWWDSWIPWFVSPSFSSYRFVGNCHIEALWFLRAQRKWG